MIFEDKCGCTLEYENDKEFIPLVVSLCDAHTLTKVSQ